MAKQLNVFVENKPGRFKKVTGILSESGINIRAIEIQDRGDFGMMKLLVNDPSKANLALKEAGLASALRDIVAIEMEDKPGALFKLADLFDSNNVNMLDAYGFVVQPQKEAIWCVEVEDVEHVSTMVENNGFRVLDESELYEY